MFNSVLDARTLQIPIENIQHNMFKPSKNGDNVIMCIEPYNLNNANFNKITHPEELYNITFLKGNKSIKPAKDININALETHKTTYEYNILLNSQLNVHNQNPNIGFGNNNGYGNGNGFVYTRCSRENDISIETQRKSCLQYALHKKINLLSYGYQSDNNVCARNMNNLKYELGFWNAHIPNGSHIIIYSVDRLSRHMLKGLQFLDAMVARNISVHFVTNDIIYNRDISAGHKAMIQSELQSAEKYSNLTSEKIKGSLKRLREEGNEYGYPGYGFKSVIINNIRKKIPNKSEKTNIEIIKNKYNDIHENFNHYRDTEQVRRSQSSIIKFIIRWCVRSGIKNRKLMPFTISQIKSIVSSD